MSSNHGRIDDELDGQADLKRVERFITRFETSRNDYFKRALWIYIFSLAFLEALAAILTVKDLYAYLDLSRTLARGAVIGSLIPVAIYFVAVWIKNNFLH